MKKFSWILFFLFPALQGFSQSYYHLQYNSPVAGDSTVYNAFFTVYDNGTAIARISFANATSGSVILETQSDQQYARSNAGTTDTSMLVFENRNSQVISGTMPGGFNAPVYWFSVSPTDNSALPVFLTSNASDTSGKMNFSQAEIVSPAQLIDTSFVLNYFTRDDIFYQNRFGNNSKGGGMLTSDEKKQRIFVLVVASTHDKTIAQGVLMDGRKIFETFGNIAAFLGIKPVFDSVYGDNYGRKSVDNALKRIEAAEKKYFNPNDIIIFWYSVHGFSDVHSRDITKRTKLYANMDLLNPQQKPRPEPRDSTMNVEDVYNRIKKMGCRFNLVVANCCNDEIIPKPETNLPPSPHPKGGPGPKWKWDNVYALFMKQRQSFLLASASQGQESFTSNVSGSIYVNFLLNSLTTGFLPDKPLPNWPQIIQDVKMQTISRINNANITCPVPFQPNNLCVQTPTCLDCNKLSNH